MNIKNVYTQSIKNCLQLHNPFLRNVNYQLTLDVHFINRTFEREVEPIDVCDLLGKFLREKLCQVIYQYECIGDRCINFSVRKNDIVVHGKIFTTYGIKRIKFCTVVKLKWENYTGQSIHFDLT